MNGGESRVKEEEEEKRLEVIFFLKCFFSLRDKISNIVS